ncbi:MAG: hypothetical protein N4A49_07595 [Marinifilaceae bacterium]|nr:hypothetical protein [Marinifilaceae bacterium]
MGNTDIIRLGQLTKEETLEQISTKLVDNTVVLEATKPFPGYFEYYENFKNLNIPHYLYFVLSKEYSLEAFTRANQVVGQNFDFEYHAACGFIYHRDKAIPVIRVRRLESYNLIKPLQELFIDEGIELEVSVSFPKMFSSLIVVNKFFSLEKLEDDFYLDAVEANHGYFTIPSKLNWKEFENLTRMVKYNMEVFHFDVSLGFMYTDNYIVDLIRVYTEDIDLDILQKIKSVYIHLMKKERILL